VPKLSRLTRGRETSALRVLSVIYGLLAMMLAFLYTNLGSLIQMAGVIIGGCSGPIFAYLIMSLFVPFVNLKGSTFGKEKFFNFVYLHQVKQKNFTFSSQ